MREWTVRVAAWTVIGGVLAALSVAVLVPRLAGATPYTVLTGSMEPGMPPGAMVVVRPVEPADIGVGSVITYQVRSGEPAVVTHRVVAQGVQNGEPVFQTRGDANEVADADWVRPVQIRGEAWYAVPWLGHLNAVLTGSERQFGVQVVAGLLLGYALVMLVGARRERQARSETSGRRRGAHV